MKKINILTAILTLLTSITMLSQNYSTGTIMLNNTINFTTKIDVNQEDDIVTLTLSGDDGRYLAIGFDAVDMTAGNDVIMFNGTTVSDRNFVGFREPAVDNSQDWTIVSNEVSNSIRTLVATRPLNTNDSNDFVFPAEETNINLVWAYGADNNTSARHANRGATSTQFTLGVEELFAEEFAMFPNPAIAEVEINLPKNIRKGFIFVTDQNGKIVLTSKIKESNKILNVSSLPTGMYFLNFETLFGNITKKIIKK